MQADRGDGPAARTIARGRAAGHALVAMQMLCLFGLALRAAPAFMDGRAGSLAWALAGTAGALGAWSLANNRPGNFNIHPAPRAGGQLVQQGPYRWVRHPMYSAVLLVGAALASASGDWPAWMGLATLAAVLGAKAGLEERWLLVHHPGYASYRARTARFLPGVF